VAPHTFSDAHCHLADPRFAPHLEGVLARARAAGIGTFLQGGVDPEDWRRQAAIDDPGVLPCFGLHPWFVAGADEARCQVAFRELEACIEGAAALGELGLDRGPKVTNDSFALQKKMFAQQLELAAGLGKPLVLHVVRAHGAALAMLREHGASWRGLVHGFTGALEVARQYIELGISISVGGVILNKQAKRLRTAVAGMPPEHLLVESDGPWGEKSERRVLDHPLADRAELPGEPLAIFGIARELAKVTGRDSASLLRDSHRNLCRIFALET